MKDLMADAAFFVNEWVLPKSEADQEYLERFAAADYRPDLLFVDTEICRAAQNSPEALWKQRNLEKMQR